MTRSGLVFPVGIGAVFQHQQQIGAVLHAAGLLEGRQSRLGTAGAVGLAVQAGRRNHRHIVPACQLLEHRDGGVGGLLLGHARARRCDKLQVIQKQHRAFVMLTEGRHFFIQKSRGKRGVRLPQLYPAAGLLPVCGNQTAHFFFRQLAVQQRACTFFCTAHGAFCDQLHAGHLYCYKQHISPRSGQRIGHLQHQGRFAHAGNRAQHGQPGVQTAVERLVQTGDTRRHHRSAPAAAQIREELVLQGRLLLYILRRCSGLTGGLQRNPVPYQRFVHILAALRQGQHRARNPARREKLPQLPVHPLPCRVGIPGKNHPLRLCFPRVQGLHQPAGVGRTAERYSRESQFL